MFDRWVLPPPDRPIGTGGGDFGLSVEKPPGGKASEGLVGTGQRLNGGRILSSFKRIVPAWARAIPRSLADAARLAATPVTPNHITGLTLVLGLVAAWLFATGDAAAAHWGAVASGGRQPLSPRAHLGPGLKLFDQRSTLDAVNLTATARRRTQRLFRKLT